MSFQAKLAGGVTIDGVKPEEYEKPTVPIGYVQLTLEQARDRKLPREAVLKDIALPDGVFERPDARIPLLTYGNIVARVLRLSGDAGLGYDFGLRNVLTAHGMVGLGAMSQPTLRQVIEFRLRFFVQLRSPGFSVRFFTEGDQGVIDVRETVPFGPLRQYAFDMLLVSMAQLHRQLLPDAQLELWFDCAEPTHYARYRDRLPPARFSMGANQLRFPVAALDQPIETADAATARRVTRELEHEMQMLGTGVDLLDRVRALLVNQADAYPSLAQVAGRLHMSTRTLNRKLREHGRAFGELLDEARRRDSVSLLRRTTLTVEEIAARLGYSDAATFSRAFRKWNGVAPGKYREAGGSA